MKLFKSVGVIIMSEKKHIIDNAELMAEWDWEKNNAIGLTPQILSIGSHKVAFWICLIHKTQYKQVIRDKKFRATRMFDLSAGLQK
jgi:hypothetical protein